MQRAPEGSDASAPGPGAGPQNGPAPASSASPRRRRKSGLDPLWLAVPGIVFLLLFLVGPAAQILSLSLLDRVTGVLTAAAFVRIVTSGPYLAVLLTTFSVALWTTLLCVVLGYPLAYWLCRMPPRRQRVAALFVLLPFGPARSSRISPGWYCWGATGSSRGPWRRSA